MSPPTSSGACGTPAFCSDTQVTTDGQQTYAQHHQEADVHSRASQGCARGGTSCVDSAVGGGGSDGRVVVVGLCDLDAQHLCRRDDAERAAALGTGAED